MKSLEHDIWGDARHLAQPRLRPDKVNIGHMTPEDLTHDDMVNVFWHMRPEVT